MTIDEWVFLNLAGGLLGILLGGLLIVYVMNPLNRWIDRQIDRVFKRQS